MHPIENSIECQTKPLRNNSLGKSFLDSQDLELILSTIVSEMKIYLRNIKEQPKHLKFTELDAWLLNSVSQADEITPSHSHRTLEARVEIYRVDEVIFAIGTIDALLYLLCSRCACTFSWNCKTTFTALYCRNPEMASIAYLEPGPSSKKRNPQGTHAGFARHAHSFDTDLISDLDITYLSQDYIDLGETFVEQLRLRTPFQPLCYEECEGMCAQCGVNRNQESCTCLKSEGIFLKYPS